MKKILISLTIIAMVMSIGPVGAQGPQQPQRFRNEVSAGAGVLSNSDILNFATNVVISTITLTAYTSRNMHWTGTFHASYKNMISKHSAIGGTLAYCGNTADAYAGNTMKGRFHNNYYTMAAEYDLRYINKPIFNLYSTIGLGATIYHLSYKPLSGSDNDASATSGTMGYFDFQLSLLGFRVGNRFGAFGELGVGYKGILNGGIFMRF
ncbi:hypothetical protein FACS1894159_04160 [Bacteroidia bacterium]|nr:hypothetical protein FACS1894159_04160 [Bacteroidia bacterium]